MNADQHIWRVWAEVLHRWGVDQWAATFLEAAGPLSTIGAQAVYFSEPFLRQTLPEGHFAALARLLEEPGQTQAFATLLREEPFQ